MLVNTSEIQRLLRKSEGPKLDFKREFYALHSAAKEMHWCELIKDVLSLANGNVNCVNQAGYLIIGAADKLNADGNRPLLSCKEISVDRQAILDKVNSACYPPLSDLQIEKLQVSDAFLHVIMIPPSYFLHETIRDLTTTKTTYHKGTVFIRQGESIRNATQVERDAIREEKQRLAQLARSTSALQRRIDASEQFIEERKADIAEHKTISSSRRHVDLEHMKDEVNFEMHILDYLKTKLRFEQSLINLDAHSSQRGKKLFDYAIKLLNEKAPRIVRSLSEDLPFSNSGNAGMLLDEIREEAKNVLESAIRWGMVQPRIYLLLMQLYDAKNEILGAYEWGSEAWDLEHEFADLHLFHMRICHSVKGLFEDYQEEATIQIERHKQRLCQILKVDAVDDWGQPL